LARHLNSVLRTLLNRGFPGLLPFEQSSKSTNAWSSREEAGRGRPSEAMAAPESKSWLPSGFASPWQSNPSSRVATLKPPMTASGVAGEGPSGQQRGGDHTLSHRHWVSLKKYPPDCPPLNARWFYAVDVSA
jgi:hypothetical protein